LGHPHMVKVLGKTTTFSQPQLKQLQKLLEEVSHADYGDVASVDLDDGYRSVDAKVGVTVIEHDGDMNVWGAFDRWKGVVVGFSEDHCDVIVAYDLCHGANADFHPWNMEELWEGKWNTVVSTELFCTPEYTLVEKEPTWCDVDGKYHW
jgi:hypothetical protein